MDATAKAIKALKTGAKRKLAISDKPQFISRFGIYDNHSW
jgi:hypothetical protein